MSSSPWGALSSTYPSLSEAQVCALERAVRLQVQVRYGESEQAFQDSVIPYHHATVVVERSILYERIGHEGERERFLKQFHDTQGTEPPDGVHVGHLLKVLHISAHFWATGQSFEEVESLVEIFDRLCELSPDAYNDVEARCLLEVHNLLEVCRPQSNWIERLSAHVKNLPSIALVREKLQDRGQHMVAQSLILAESAGATEDATAPFSDFFRRAASLERLQDEAVLTKLGISRTHYAQKLAEAGNLDAAREQQSKAEALLIRAATLPGGSGQLNPRLQLLLDRLKLATDPPPPYEQVVAYQKLASRAKEIKDHPLQRLHLDKAQNLLQVQVDEANLSRERRAMLRQSLLEILGQRLHLEEHVESKFFYQGALLRQGYELMRMGALSFERWLDMVKEEGATEYGTPLGRFTLFDLAWREAHDSGKSAMAEHFKLKSEQALQECRGLVEPTRASTSTTYTTIDDGNYGWEWRPVVDENWVETYMTVACRVLLRFVSLGLRSNTLDEDKAATLLRWSKLDTQQLWPEAEDLTEHLVCKLRRAIWGEEKEINEEKRTVIGQEVASVETVQHRLDTLSLEEKGAAAGKPGHEAKKMTKPIGSDDWDKWIVEIEKWLLGHETQPSKEQRQHLLYQIRRCRAQNLFDYAGLNSGGKPLLPLPVLCGYYERGFDEHERFIKLLPRLDAMQISTESARITIKCAVSYAIELTSLQGQQGLTPRVRDDLEAALGRARHLREQYRDQGLLVDECDMLVKIAQVLYRQSMFNLKDCMLECLETLQKAEALYSQFRRECALKHPGESFLAKKVRVEKLGIGGIYSQALGACHLFYLSRIFKYRFVIADKLEEITRVHDELFFWIQRSKGRILTDLLGTAQSLPANMTQAIHQYPQTAALLDEQSVLTEGWDSLSIAQEMARRKELGRLSKEMRDVARRMDPDDDKTATRAREALDALLDLQEGAVVTSHEVRELSDEMGPDVVICEWVEQLFGLFLAIYEGGRITSWHELPITMAQVKVFTDKHMNEKYVFADTYKAGDGQRTLNQLDKVVSPIFDTIKPGVPLIFCPTGELHRVPLHAIQVNGELVLERHAVTYCQSLSILRLCHRHVQSRDVRSTGEREELVAAAFDMLGNDLYRDDLDKAARSLGTSLTGHKSLDKTLFSKLVSKPDVIMTFGHVEFNQGDPLASHLLIGDQEQAKNKQIKNQEQNRDQEQVKNERIENQEQNGDQEQVKNEQIENQEPNGDQEQVKNEQIENQEQIKKQKREITARDLFGMSFKRPSIFACIGCQGARSHILQGDDLLGLTAAFHYAGVSAFISTLWPVSQPASAVFSAIFCRELVAEMRRLTTDYVDLGVVLRTAVIGFRNDKDKPRAPYEWAAFYLHGSSKFPRLHVRDAS